MRARDTMYKTRSYTWRSKSKINRSNKGRQAGCQAEGLLKIPRLEGNQKVSEVWVMREQNWEIVKQVAIRRRKVAAENIVPLEMFLFNIYHTLVHLMTIFIIHNSSK